jgi:hypothetical protein
MGAPQAALSRHRAAPAGLRARPLKGERPPGRGKPDKSPTSGHPGELTGRKPPANPAPPAVVSLFSFRPSSFHPPHLKSPIRPPRPPIVQSTRKQLPSSRMESQNQRLELRRRKSSPSPHTHAPPLRGLLQHRAHSRSTPRSRARRYSAPVFPSDLAKARLVLYASPYALRSAENGPFHVIRNRQKSSFPRVGKGDILLLMKTGTSPFTFHLPLEVIDPQETATAPFAELPPRPVPETER